MDDDDRRRSDRDHRRLKIVTFWMVIVGTGLASAAFLASTLQLLLFERDIALEIITEHFAATVGLPFAAIAALVLVIILEASSGPMEFEALGFRFKGASGQVVLWIAVFLAITLAIKLLW